MAAYRPALDDPHAFMGLVSAATEHIERSVGAPPPRMDEVIAPRAINENGEQTPDP